MSDKDFDDVVDINLKGVFIVSPTAHLFCLLACLDLRLTTYILAEQQSHVLSLPAVLVLPQCWSRYSQSPVGCSVQFLCHALGLYRRP